MLEQAAGRASTVWKWLACLLMLIALAAATRAPALELAQYPLYQAPPRKPMVMLTMSKDHPIFYKAYDDYSDLDSDGIADTSYKHSIDYYGYFDSGKCYTYSSGIFVPSALSSSKYCSGAWSGNFLNWASMARIDITRKVLYGGYRSTDSAVSTETQLSSTSSAAAPVTTTTSGRCDSRSSRYNCPASSTVTTGCTSAPSSAGSCTGTVTTTNVSLCGYTSSSCSYTKTVTSQTTTYVTTANDVLVPGKAVIERTYLPNDAHSWVKVYSGSDIAQLTPFSVSTISLCNTTVDTAGNLSQNVTAPPLLRVANGNYTLWAANERWQCRWNDEKNTGSNGNGGTIPGASDYTPGTSSGLGDKDYIVRVQTCVESLLGDEKCKRYPNGDYKPVGLLQDYGDSDQMYFGLLTGSYGANKSGGVLRKNLSSWRDEINATTGQFVTPSSGQGIQRTLSALRIYGYRHSDGTYFGTTGSDNCSWGLSSFSNGNCSNWGNPQAEVFLEALRYLGGKSATAAFNVDDSGRIAALRTATWSDVIGSSEANQCSPLSVISFNASASSYDADELGGASGVGLSSLNATTDGIGSSEGITGHNYFIGENGTNNDQLCTGKSVNALSALRGPCPDAPRLSGSYQTAGLAAYAHAHGVRTNGQQVDVFGVSLAPAPAQVTVPVPGSTRTVTIMPACRNNGVGGNCAIVEFRIVSQDLAAGTGRLYVNWEDSEQGGDYDQDMWGVIDYALTSSTLSVTTDVRMDSTSSGYLMGFGYVVSGTTQDGFHAHSGINSFSYADPTGGVQCSNCVRSDAPSTRVFTIGDSAAGFLQTPLALAAKWGGFRDRNSNGTPDAGEWENHFFDVKNPADLVSALSQVFATVASQSPSSAAVAANVRTLTTSSMLFQSTYDPSVWTGEIKAFSLDSVSGAVSSLIWKASDGVPAASARSIYTWVPASGAGTAGGAAFLWSNLNAAQQTAIGSESVLDYLRGVRTQEGSSSGQFRVRESLLGDFVNSDPVFVGADDEGFSVLPGSEGSSYAAWVAAKDSRAQILFVGANDGMLHAFDAASGAERFSFVPNGVYANLALLSQQTYGHQYYVDASPSVSDAYLGGHWKTVLVGALGAGGRSVFALDVSDPAAFGAGQVLWEFSDDALGVGVRRVIIARTASTAHPWVAIFGNGYNSTGTVASVFILDLASGERVAQLTPDSGASGENGMAVPLAWDANGDGIADTIYVGDLQGHLWKFDISSSDAGAWGSAYRAGGYDVPLFTARGPDEEVQAITAQPAAAVGSDGILRVYFGTGKYLEAIDAQVLDAPSVDSFYAIDDTGSALNVTGAQRDTVLQRQSIIAEYPAGTNGSYPLRVTSAVSDMSTDERAADPRGWFMDLVEPDGSKHGERIVEAPLVYFDRVMFVTMLPTVGDECSGGGDGWIMTVMADSGDRVSQSTYDLNGDGAYNAGDEVTVTINGSEQSVAVSGLNPGLGVIGGTPTLVGGSTSGSATLYDTGSSGGLFSIGVRGAETGGRRSWLQLQ